MEISKTFLRPDRLDYLTLIASVSPWANRRRRALYLLSGSDFITSYLLSNGAGRTIMVDRLPFHGVPMNEADHAARRSEYHYKKYELNFSVEPDLLSEVGCLQYLLWEFEAMGISDCDHIRSTLVEDAASRSYELHYQFPGEAEKCLVYYQVEDARSLEHYPEKLRREISEGIDCIIRKAAVNVMISSEVMAFIASSMDKHGLMFIDDRSRAMHGDSNALICPMSETAMRAIRAIEASRSILFGYNPVSIYQGIAARREWEVDRRYRQDSIPRLMIFLNSRPSLDLQGIKCILENSSAIFVLVGDTEGTDILSQRYPERFLVETTYSPESLIERYLGDPGATCCILGDGDEAKHFTHLQQIKYFITSSVDYPYVNYKVEHLIPICLCGEEEIPEHERIFCPSLDSNRLWLRFDLFRQINPENVEAEISNFSQQVIARLTSKRGVPAI